MSEEEEQKDKEITAQSETIRWAELTPQQRDRLILLHIFHMEFPKYAPCIISPFSQYMGTAWQLVSIFDEVELAMHIEDRWHCTLHKGTGEGGAIAKTAPEAICIAALRYMGVEVDTSSSPPSIRRTPNTNVNPPGGSTTGWVDIAQLSVQPPESDNEK